MANYLVQHPLLDGEDVSVVTSTFAGPKLFHGNTEVKREKKVYPVRTRSGQEVAIRLKIDLTDMAVPKVLVNDAEVQIVQPLTLGQKIFAALPLLLIFAGGALGGALGAAAAVVNAHIFHSPRPPIQQYIFSIGTFAAATALYLVLGTLLLSAF